MDNQQVSEDEKEGGLGSKDGWGAVDRSGWQCTSQTLHIIDSWLSLEWWAFERKSRKDLTGKIVLKCGAQADLVWDGHNRCWHQTVSVRLTNWGLGKRK